MKRRRFTLITSLPQRFNNVLSPSTLNTKQTQHRVMFLLLPPSISNGACAPPLTAPISVEDVGSGASLFSTPSYTKLGSLVSLKERPENIANHIGGCPLNNSRIHWMYSSSETITRNKPIITLLEEVRMYAMRSIARNKVKLNSNTGVLPPIQRSRLEKIQKE
ncbi:hypothetical protein Ahy_B10g105552 [Arachis hypogaea]|uniref:Uncharacterized protein n=1 Tax=Arachis hypogaea TaxID=3818 RepID=A0A444X8D6_ARAHY|nr:hypothetical protein Ahy_B10g105552 [Arachis hypogaea]